MAFSVDATSCKQLSRTYGSERRLGRATIRILAIIGGTFCSILATCMLMAGLQRRAGLFFDDIMWWNSIPGGVHVNNAGVSKLQLLHFNATWEQKASASHVKAMAGDTLPHYAVCGSKWHDLSLLDYSFMAMSAYLTPKPDSDIEGLLRILMPHKKVTVVPPTLDGSKVRKWHELEVQTCNGGACQNLTVIAVSGTDPTRVMDLAECLRMWTEPVALQIVGTVFPTVRIWPRDTSAMVIAAIHNVLRALGIADDQWHYREILEHVRKLPRERQVVITGHSLGGGIALVIGALTDRLAVAIQPPGVYHSLAKHQAQQRALLSGSAVHKRSVSLIFEGDWIQNFDNHGGLVQTMSCDRSDANVMVGCHFIEGAVCHLLRHCNDDVERFVSCRHQYNPRSEVLTVGRSLVSLALASLESPAWITDLAAWQGFLIAFLTLAIVHVARFGPPPRFRQSGFSSLGLASNDDCPDTHDSTVDK